MRFLLTDDRRQVLAEINVPEGEFETVVLRRADRPDLLFAAVDLYSDGSMSVGHWPTGEDWVTRLRTSGVPEG
ncbi:hypothetical protein ACFQ7N_36885 [Streptomyces niveus]|uniref:hypothetical protein n=1 Tax=Streptomyces niveus TaxID=193462 RepID=UPI0036CB5C21